VIVLLISPCGLPVPAVKGGAVLTLIESIIIQNEKEKKMNLTVVSSYDSDAVNKSKKYKNTKFIFIKEPKLCNSLDCLYEFCYSKLLKKNHKILKRYTWKLFALKKIKKILKKYKFDKVIFENSGYLLNTLKNKKICKIYEDKLYYHLHNDIPNNIYVDGLKKCKLLLISNYLSKKIMLKCGDDILNRILILRNGFDCEKFNQNISDIEKEKIKNKLGIDKNQKVILFTGRINKEKGIKELTEAFQMLNTNKIKLLVVGANNFGAKQFSPFEEQMKETFNKLEKKVIFTGFIPYDEMWKYYKIADLAVLPSLWEEPAGLTMLEAVAAGVPLITTRTGGIPEYLEEEQVIFIDRDDEIVIKIKDCIVDYFNNEEKYKLRAKFASETIFKKYNEKIYYEKFIKYIK